MATHPPKELLLETLSQNPRINRIYTQLTFCFELRDDSLTARDEIVYILTQGLERMCNSFPWIAGKVVYDDGSFKIKLSNDIPKVMIKDLTKETPLLNWHEIREANFPFRMLDEEIIAPCKTIATEDASRAELAVFLVQANFIKGGLLLTFGAQHGAMDMAGFGQTLYLLAKACRNESFTPAEIVVGNVNRHEALELFEDNIQSIRSIGKDIQEAPKSETSGTMHLDQSSRCVWAYFLFSATALAMLKASAETTMPEESFISTNDALTALTWQAMTRALCMPDMRISRLYRQVDMRAALSIAPTYPGAMTHRLEFIKNAYELLHQPLGSIAAELRAHLNVETLRQAFLHTLAKARYQNSHFTAPTTSDFEITVSSWTKEKCYGLDFGFLSGSSKPQAVRRPRFEEGAREGLVYFLPRTIDGDIVVGLALRSEALARLKIDKDFTQYASYTG